jgi:hypothetical protein
MPDPNAVDAFLRGEVEALETFGFVAVAPAGRPLHAVEVTRREDSGLAVRVPGRAATAPELPIKIRKALRDRGFLSSEAADRTKPWIREVADASAAVSLQRAVLAEVFGEKLDAALDVQHGSHRGEYEAQRRLTRARTRIEAIGTDVLGRCPEQDEDGDFVLPVEGVHVVIAPRVTPDAQVVVRVFCICNVGIDMTPGLALFLARLNFGLMFGRFIIDVENSAIWFDETLLGEEFREEELRFAIRVVAETADCWDDRFKQMFGGSTHEEVLAQGAAEAAAKSKPGQGGGLYL